MSGDRITQVASPDGANIGIKLLGTSIGRAVPSPDGLYVAAIAARGEIQICQCPSPNRPSLCYPVTVTSKLAQKVLADVGSLRWSPEHYLITAGDPSASGDEGSPLLRSWLLVSNGRRLVVLCIELSPHDTSSASCTVSVDYDLGELYGGFAVTEFAFNHGYAVVLSSMGLQASILSLTRPERHDVANVKFRDTRGVAMSPDSRRLAVLTRSEGQDLVLVFYLTEMDTVKNITISPPTLDAQGIKWSPIGDPLLCIWDSASFGIKISFFTATGHHLVQMGLTSDNLHSDSAHSSFESLGVNTLEWIPCDEKAILAIFDCSGHLFLRQSSSSEKFHSPLLTINHDRLVDGASYQVWQESQDGNRFFTHHTTSFEPHTVKTCARGDQIALNRTGQLIATKHSSRPWTLWIWDAPLPAEPLAVINFRDRIKQLLWHPSDAHILLILTTQKTQPLIYAWDSAQRQILLTGSSGASSSPDPRSTDDGATATTKADWEGKWIGDRRIDHRPLFLIASTHRYDVGAVGIEQGRLVFKSVL